jgi:hypothetical protein
MLSGSYPEQVRIETFKLRLRTLVVVYGRNHNMNWNGGDEW